MDTSRVLNPLPMMEDNIYIYMTGSLFCKAELTELDIANQLTEIDIVNQPYVNKEFF